jgi:hypothetical protein
MKSSKVIRTIIPSMPLKDSTQKESSQRASKNSIITAVGMLTATPCLFEIVN